MNLQTKIGLLPTPTVQESKRATTNGENRSKKTGQRFGIGLAQKVLLLPTPTCNDAQNNSLPQSQALRDSVPGALIQTLGRNTGYRLQPVFVEWMMGYPPGWTELETYPAKPKKEKQPAKATESKPSEMLLFPT